ncbi:MAG: hypothetical protein JJU11_17780 [Candidatus Sumerlaeia bacterium]|nr:hypothetical protein [Candidatus Sumerlaeia bacterium]
MKKRHKVLVSILIALTGVILGIWYGLTVRTWYYSDHSDTVVVSRNDEEAYIFFHETTRSISYSPLGWFMRGILRGPLLFIDLKYIRHDLYALHISQEGIRVQIFKNVEFHSTPGNSGGSRFDVMYREDADPHREIMPRTNVNFYTYYWDWGELEPRTDDYYIEQGKPRNWPIRDVYSRPDPHSPVHVAEPFTEFTVSGRNIRVNVTSYNERRIIHASGHDIEVQEETEDDWQTITRWEIPRGFRRSLDE